MCTENTGGPGGGVKGWVDGWLVDRSVGRQVGWLNGWILESLWGRRSLRWPSWPRGKRSSTITKHHQAAVSGAGSPFLGRSATGAPWTLRCPAGCSVASSYQMQSCGALRRVAGLEMVEGPGEVEDG